MSVSPLVRLVSLGVVVDVAFATAKLSFADSIVAMHAAAMASADFLVSPVLVLFMVLGAIPEIKPLRLM